MWMKVGDRNTHFFFFTNEWILGNEKIELWPWWIRMKIGRTMIMGLIGLQLITLSHFFVLSLTFPQLMRRLRPWRLELRRIWSVMSICHSQHKRSRLLYSRYTLANHLVWTECLRFSFSSIGLLLVWMWMRQCFLLCCSAKCWGKTNFTHVWHTSTQKVYLDS